MRVARGSEPRRRRGQGGMTTQITRRDETDRDRSERASHLSSNKLNGREGKEPEIQNRISLRTF